MISKHTATSRYHWSISANFQRPANCRRTIFPSEGDDLEERLHMHHDVQWWISAACVRACVRYITTRRVASRDRGGARHRCFWYLKIPGGTICVAGYSRVGPTRAGKPHSGVDVSGFRRTFTLKDRSSPIVAHATPRSRAPSIRLPLYITLFYSWHASSGSSKENRRHGESFARANARLACRMRSPGRNSANASAAAVAGNAARLILAVTFDRREPSLDRGTPAKPPTTMIHRVFLVLSILHVSRHVTASHHSDVRAFA